MSIQRTRGLASTVGVVVVLSFTGGGCRRDREKSVDDAVGTTTTTSATLDAVLANDATEKLVEARCNHDQLCGETSGATSGKPTSCADDVRSAIGDMLAAECPRGVGKGPLDACAGALRSESCGVALLAKTIPDACRTEALCVVGALAR